MNIDRIWYQKHILSYFLWPLSLLYRGIIAGRSYLYRKEIKKTIHFPVPSDYCWKYHRRRNRQNTVSDKHC